MITTEEQMKVAAREIWLCYFNRTLYDKGIITEEMRNRMSRMIQSNGGRSPK